MSKNLCECGCGGTPRLADKNDRRKGWVKGEPKRFIRGHAPPPPPPRPPVVTRADYETADRADGAAVAAWLVNAGLWNEGQRSPLDRQLRLWRDGATPGFYTVDGVLTRLGHHPWELPDEVWLKRVAA